MAHRFRNIKSEPRRYDSQHAAARKAAATRHHPSDRCARANDPDIRCTKPLGPMGPWLHYDHDEHGGYLGFSHRKCNERAAAIKGNKRQAQMRSRARGQHRRAQSRAW